MRVLLSTIGSLGDLHPYLAIGRELIRQGHSARLATSEGYRSRVEAEGIEFAPQRPDMPEPERLKEMMILAMDERRGTETIFRKFVMPNLRDTFTDTLAAAEQADLLVSHPLTLAMPLIAELKGLPWVATSLAPISLFSAMDPPVFPAARWANSLHWVGPWFHRALYWAADQRLRGWLGEYHALRHELGLPRAVSNPLLWGQHSPYLTLALFSPVLAAPQPDWPGPLLQTGFPFHDHPTASPLPEALQTFLASGPAPVVFTLGSSAVMDARSFYRVGSAAAAELGVRAVLLIGKDEQNRIEHLPPGQITAEYAPYAALFPHAAAVVHQGGVGTTAEALRAGAKMIVVPFAHDQPDHASRITRAGLGGTLNRNQFTVKRVSRLLKQLLADHAMTQRCQAAGLQVSQETGAETAARAIIAIGQASTT